VAIVFPAMGVLGRREDIFPARNISLDWDDEFPNIAMICEIWNKLRFHKWPSWGRVNGILDEGNVAFCL
jgi:hypothetical protein